jgi:hypothetical protein
MFTYMCGILKINKMETEKNKLILKSKENINKILWIPLLYIGHLCTKCESFVVFYIKFSVILLIFSFDFSISLFFSVSILFIFRIPHMYVNISLIIPPHNILWSYYTMGLLVTLMWLSYLLTSVSRHKMETEKNKLILKSKENINKITENLI